MPALYRIIPGSALYMASVAQARYLLVVAASRWPDRIPAPLLHPTRRTPSPLADFLIAGSCRTTIGILLNPFTVIKTRFESKRYGGRQEYQSVLAAARDVVRGNGLWRGLWSGWGAVVLRDAPYSSLFLAAYGSLKRQLEPKLTSQTVAHAFSAGIAAAFACTVTQPFDLARARMQLEPAQYRNTFQSMLRIISEEGYGALGTGFVPRLARKSLSSVLAWVLFDRLTGKA